MHITATFGSTLLVMIFLCGIWNYYTCANYRNIHELRKTSSIKKTEKDIQAYCHTNTRALGFFVPVIYSDLKWDSYYHMIDIGDLSQSPETYQYISNELNNNLKDPVLIDKLTLDELEKKINLNEFKGKFSKQHEFTLEKLTILYFTKK